MKLEKMQVGIHVVLCGAQKLTTTKGTTYHNFKSIATQHNTISYFNY